MKPWPEIITAIFPLLPGRRNNPDRPWWAWTNGGAWSRTDGASVHVGGIDAGFSGDPWGINGEPQQGHTDAISAMAAYDQKHPLPFPGVRPGQIWCWAIRDATGQDILWSVTMGPLRFYAGSQEIRWEHDGHAEDGLPDWCDLKLTRIILRDAYLIADPACPWLAPWAPSA